MPVVTDTLCDRIVAIEIDNLESRLRPYAAREGNPSGIHIERFGRATAFVARNIPIRFFNSVLGTGEDTLAHLNAIETFYASRGAGRPSFEIVPSRMTEPLGEALSSRGYAMVEFHAALATDPRTVKGGDAPEVEVIEIDPTRAADLERFLDVYLEGWSAPDPGGSKINMRLWRSSSTWRFYLAAVDREPAGAAILDVRGTTAILGSASTRPEMRGRRVQGALLQRRIADAAAAGVDLLVGGAYFGTTSMRNQQRAGLEIAFTRGIWTAPR